MMTNEIVAAIDAEIHKLQQVKALLNGSGDHSGAGKTSPAPFKRRNVSPEARARVAAAQTARSAKIKKATK